MRSMIAHWAGLTRDNQAVSAGLPERRLAERSIQALDRMLRRYHGVFEFTDDPECIIRIAWRTAGRGFTLRRGGRVEPADTVVELHLWNEQLPPISDDGVDMAWGAAVDRQARRSLNLLAAYLATRPDIVAVHGDTAFGCQMGEPQRARLAARYGFEIVDGRPGLRRRLQYLCDDFMVWFLTRTFNPHTLKGKPFHRPRYDIWMSRDELDRRWGKPGADE